MNEAEFQRNLTRFKAVLKREKRYLIKNDGEKVTETVSQKEKFIPIFENYDGPVSDKTKAMIDEIQELQSVNLMLTNQAIAFQKTLMDAIQANLKQPKRRFSSERTCKRRSRPRRAGSFFQRQAYAMRLYTGSAPNRWMWRRIPSARQFGDVQ